MPNLPPFLEIPWCWDAKPFGPSTPLVLTPEAQAFLHEFQQQLAATSQQPVTPVTLTDQSASIASTDLVALAAGTYRISFVGHVTQAAAVSSSLQMQVIATEGAIVCTQTSTAVTTNTTGTVTSPSFLVVADSGTPISFATIYASVGAPIMKYSLKIVVEKLA